MALMMMRKIRAPFKKKELSTRLNAGFQRLIRKILILKVRRYLEFKKLTDTPPEPHTEVTMYFFSSSGIFGCLSGSLYTVNKNQTDQMVPATPNT